MKIAILIDYANFFISIKRVHGLKDINEIEDKICSVINNVSKYICENNEYNKKGVEVVMKKAFVLDDKSFGHPEDTLPKNNILVERVKDVNEKKTDVMKDMNQSRLDDEVLMEEGMKLSNTGVVDGILVVTNDGDFASLGEKLGYIGREFWVGAYEGKEENNSKDKGKYIRTATKLKNAADLVLPLKDIYEGIDEAEAVEAWEEIIEEDIECIKGPRILIFRKGKIIAQYPVGKTLIGIGRRSTRRHYFPNIDLTEYDTEKIVSRQHAEIRKINNKLIFSVHKNCSRGTWVDRNPIFPLQQFILKPGMAVVIGDKTGFGIKYIEE